MKVKRLAACVLASVLALSTAFTSYATGAGSSAGQGDAGNTGSTNNKGNGTWSVTANTGFRFTIVDGEGVPVSKILCCSANWNLQFSSLYLNQICMDVSSACYINSYSFCTLSAPS